MHPQVCWERSVETLTARKADVAGLAVVSDERIEAYVLYATGGPAPGEDAGTDPAASSPEVEILSLRSSIDDGGARLKQLLARLRAPGTGTIRFSKVHPAEIPAELLETLGFRRAGGHLRYAATARSA